MDSKTDCFIIFWISEVCKHKCIFSGSCCIENDNTLRFISSLVNNIFVWILNDYIDFMLIDSSQNKIISFYLCRNFMWYCFKKHSRVTSINIKCCQIIRFKITHTIFPNFLYFIALQFKIIFNSKSVDNFLILKKFNQILFSCFLSFFLSLLLTLDSCCLSSFCFLFIPLFITLSPISNFLMIIGRCKC